eukprot:4109058-Heterocapsa_arctica.AAC.1
MKPGLALPQITEGEVLIAITPRPWAASSPSDEAATVRVRSARSSQVAQPPFREGLTLAVDRCIPG